MPKITIPEQHASGLLKIIGLSAEDSQRVAVALQEAKSINKRDLLVLVSHAAPSLNKEDVDEIVSTLLSLYAARTAMDLTVESFVTEVLAAVVPSESIDARRAEIQKNLTELLNVRPLSMISKARGVHTDHENTFCSIRILTDLRPVFDVDVKDDPVGFVLFHVLKIGYHHAGKHTTMHIAMDKVDVDNMINALTRAKDKAATLSTAISEKCGYAVLAD